MFQKFRGSRLARGMGWVFRGATLTTLVLLILLACTRFSNRPDFFLDIPASFQMHYLLCGLFLFAFCALLRWRVLSGIALALVTVQVIAVSPYFVGNVPQLKAGHTELKVGVANLFMANKLPYEFQQWVENEQPDILLLQEAGERWPAFLQNMSADYPHQFLTLEQDWGFDCAVLSKLPFEEQENLWMPPHRHPVQRVVVAPSGSPVALYNQHLYLSGPDRQGENQFLVAAFRKEAIPYVVAGDFNATIWSQGQRDLLSKARLHNAAFGSGYTPTWPMKIRPVLAYASNRYFGRTMNPFGRERYWPSIARFIGVPIDHCYISDGLGIADYSLAPYINSDHMPLNVTLQVPAVS